MGRRLASALLLCFTLFLAAGRARGDEHEGQHEGGQHEGQHAASHRVQVGFTGSSLWGFTPEGLASHVGGGLFAEFVLLPHHLELGAVFHAHSTKDALEFPIDLLLIKPFAVSRLVHPFLGAGVTVIPVLGTSTFDINAGLATSFGLHLWLRPDIAMVFEGNFNYICERAYSRPRGAPAAATEPTMPAAETPAEVHGGAWGPEVGFNSGFLIAF